MAAFHNAVCDSGRGPLPWVTVDPRLVVGGSDDWNVVKRLLEAVRAFAVERSMRNLGPGFRPGSLGRRDALNRGGALDDYRLTDF